MWRMRKVYPHFSFIRSSSFNNSSRYCAASINSSFLAASSICFRVVSWGFAFCVLPRIIHVLCTAHSCVAQLAEHPTVNRTVTGSSPVAGAIESLGSPRLFYFHRIGGQTRHPIINREIHGEDLTTTHIRQTGHCQFTDERHGIPSISLGIPRKSYIETLVRGMAESIGKSGALGATPASTRFTPSMATMAPLSVQSLICGIRTSTP